MTIVRERKLEAAALFIVAAMFIAMLWSGISGRVSDLKQGAAENEQQASTCSRLEVSIIDRESNGTHTTVYFSSNTDVDILEARFSSGNTTAVRNVTDVRGGILRRASAPLPDAQISVDYPPCR